MARVRIGLEDEFDVMIVDIVQIFRNRGDVDGHSDGVGLFLLEIIGKGD